MQIFYCDKCGMRIPQAQIDNGQAAHLGDEKLACPACTKQVDPRPAARPQAKSSGIRLDAIQPVKNPASSGMLVPYRRPARESGAAQDRHGGHGHGAKGADSSSSAKLYAGVGIGFFVILLGVIFASGGNKKVETDRRESADIPRAKTADAPATALAQSKGPQLLTPPARTTPDPRHEVRTVPESLPGPPLPDPQENAEPDREDLAADAFDVLKKFDGLAEDDKDGRKRKIESFLETYADTLAGARARVLLQNLEAGVSTDETEDAKEPVEVTAGKVPSTKHVKETVEADGTRVAVLALPWVDSGGTEAPDGAMKTSTTYLNVGNADMKTVTFMHFPAFPVPPRAKILEAHIQFTCKHPQRPSSNPPPAKTIEAEAADCSVKPGEMQIAGRKRTQAQVFWTPPAWSSAGERTDKQRTPDLSSLIQEVVDRPGWQAKNAILFLFSKGSRHSAYPRDLKDPARSPALTVRYREAGAVDPASTESASGPAQPAATGDAGLLQVLAVLTPELRKGEFEDAAERVNVLLKDPKFAGAAEALAREKRDLAAVLALRDATIASLNEGGKAVKLNKGKLDLDGKTVRGTDHTKVTVRVTGGLEMVVYAREFSAAEIARYAPQPRTADERRAHAYLHLATGDAAQAKAVLVEAGKNGDPGLQPYLDRLELAALDPNDLKAKAAWLGVEKHVTDGRLAEAAAELKAFQGAYGDTAFANDIAATLKARAREIDKALNPYMPGLKGEYFKNNALKPEEMLKERIDATIDFRWNNAAPMAGVPENFAARWTGFLKVPKKGTYTLAASVDDGTRLYVAGNKVIDRWTSSPEKKHEAAVDLDEGYHALKIEYFDGNSTAVCVLSWSLKDGFEEQVVPPEALWHRDESKPAAAGEANPDAGAPADALKPVTLAPGEGIFLGEIKPKSVRIGGGKYAADGTLGHSPAKISVGGVESPHGICTHPFENGASAVDYELDRPYRQFIGHVAINDNGGARVPLTFTVELNGKTAWTSRPLQTKGDHEAYAIDVTGAKTLKLKVDCKGPNDNAVAVWFEPRLLLASATDATREAANGGSAPVYLSDLQEISASVVEGWSFGKKGKMGHSNYTNDPISANGVVSPNGINMTPPDKDKAIATYAINKNYAVFESRVAICDTSKDKAKGPAIFKVYGDDRLLWQSNPIQMTKVIEDCKVDVRQVTKLTLEVECLKGNSYLHAVWLEPRLLEQAVAASPNPAPPNPAPAAGPAQVYLADLPEQNASVVANWKFGKKGQTGAPAGDKNEKILVAGFESPNGLSLHPPSNGNSHVAYHLDKKYRTFTTRVGLNDSSANKAASPVIFKVLGDGKLLWRSKSIQKLNNYDGCNLNISGIDKLELEVECKGDASRCHAIWIEPVVNR
ncbi:MAG: NPCBM/NEW2 domain-containing protein [Planctomycetes bacterium]|nr:NPCBM/NEW2 domain-containing protein [Planctomycetota bacterium]